MSNVNLQSLFKRTLAHAKIPYAARRAQRDVFAGLVRDNRPPRAGDLVLARVDKIGQHKHLELANGRRARLFSGDEIILVYGNRYAPDQFEAEVPERLGVCHMAAAGGIAARVIAKHPKMGTPTTVDPLGFVTDDKGRVVNLEHFALGEVTQQKPRPFTIAVVGTSMNAGKTETATHIVHGLKRAGLRVGAAKVTGTGAGPDAWSMLDAGAFRVLDFGDAGLASTYLAGTATVEAAFNSLTDHLANDGAEAIVLEVADGVFQRETAALLKSKSFKEKVDAMIFASGDAMGSAQGVQWLHTEQLPIRALCGIVSASPLGAREASDATGLPVLTLEHLSKPTIASFLHVPVPKVRVVELAAA